MPSVLIVEDDDDVRDFMRMLVEFSLQGYDVVTAWNGREALRKLQGFRPHVILLDLHMPVMNGFEFRRRQLADPELARIPVICVTAHYDPRRVTHELGIPCFSKPIENDDVINAVKHAISQN